MKIKSNQTFNERAKELVYLKYGYKMLEEYFDQFNNLAEVYEHFDRIKSDKITRSEYLKFISKKESDSK